MLDISKLKLNEIVSLYTECGEMIYKAFVENRSLSEFGSFMDIQEFFTLEYSVRSLMCEGC